MEYRALTEELLTGSLLDDFERRQTVTKCWRRRGGEWRLEDVPFTDDWSKSERAAIAASLQRAAAAGGFVHGAFDGGRLCGFVCVLPEPLGSAGQYLDLAELHVSAEHRRRGAGRALFSAAADWARARGAEKLYISAHSAMETQAFYRAAGCVEAREYDPAHVLKEPCDCQLEFVL